MADVDLNQEQSVEQEQIIENAAVRVEQPIDSKIEISVSNNVFEAFIIITEPKFGGKTPKYEDILSEIELNRIVHGLKPNLLHSIIDEKKYGEKYCFALYTPPTNGKDGEIKYRFSKETSLAPVEDERGFVNYKDLGIVRNITAGTIIADITEPTEGEAGMDIRGNPIRCIPGKKAKFTVGPNTKLTDDGLQIVATLDGNINFRNGTFAVDNVVNIKGDVDASVGNIEFSGDVIIKGEVKEGFKVISKSNIIVQGNVNGAYLQADGDVLVKKGCINSQIKAGGSVSINFCEYSKIKCEGDLTSVNFVICDVYCAGTMTTKGNHGGIHGGKYTCLNSVESYDIGTKNYVRTELSIGDNAVLTNEKNQLISKVSEIERKTNETNLIIDFLKEKQKQKKYLSPDKEKMLGDSVRQKVLFGVEISKIQKRIAEIDLALRERQYLSVSCKGTIYPGVKIIINDQALNIEEEHRKSKVALNDDGLIFIGPA